MADLAVAKIRGKGLEPALFATVCVRAWNWG